MLVEFKILENHILRASIGNYHLLRVPYINSKENLHHIEKYFTSKKVAIVEYNTNLEEWSKLILEHQNVIIAKYIHLSLPIRPFYFEKSYKEPTENEQQFADAFPKLLNMEGWTEYASFVSEKYQNQIKKFNYDTVDAYTLEARLNDFKKEVLSNILQKNLDHIRDIEINLSQKYGQGISEGTFEEEKQLIKLRKEIHSNIDTLYQILGKIVENIQSIEKAHPELKLIEDLTIIIRSLLQNQLTTTDTPALTWGKREILLQLLDEELDIQPVLNCSNDQGRTLFALAIRLSTLQMRQKYSVEKMMEMVGAWELKHPELVAEFRNDVYENLRKTPHGKMLKPTTELLVEREYLNYLPKHLVQYDLSTQQPIKLTEEGSEFMHEILFK